MALTHPLTPKDILALAQRLMEGGAGEPGKVLSVYLELPPDVRHERRRWSSTLNSGLRELRSQNQGDRDLERLTDLAAASFQGLSPELRGRSLAYFATSSGQSWQASLQMSTGTSFAWHTRPVLRPLLAVVTGAPITGVVVLAQDKARLLSWRQGLINEEQVLQADLDTSDWRRFRAAAGADRSQGASTHVDDFQARFDEQIDHFVRGLANQVAAQGKAAGWELVTVFATPRLAELLASSMVPSWRERVLPPGDVNLIKAGREELAEHVTGEVGRWHQARQVREVQSALDLARAGGAAAVGPQDCLNLIAQHRVAQLYFQNDITLAGYPREDGSYNLYPPPGQPEAEVEPQLIEWVITTCLASGAQVTPVGGPAAKPLADAGGMVATLRY